MTFPKGAPPPRPRCQGSLAVKNVRDPGRRYTAILMVMSLRREEKIPLGPRRRPGRPPNPPSPSPRGKKREKNEGENTINHPG